MTNGRGRLRPAPYHLVRNLKLILSYDGSEFEGWQTQPGRRTVQETLEGAVEKLIGVRPTTYASGRTDAGVHALGQVVSFRTESPLETEVFVRGLNAHLPDDVRVLAAEEVAEEFHANYSATSKVYRYLMHDGPVLVPVLRRYCWHSKFALDHEAMHRAAQSLVGTHDFRSFETEWPNRSSSVRTVSCIEVTRLPVWDPGGWDTQSPRAATRGLLGEVTTRLSEVRGAAPFLALEVEADGFLYNMVRAIAGTLVNVGRGYWPETKVREALEARDRRAAGPNAPACGLFLVRVRY